VAKEGLANIPQDVFRALNRKRAMQVGDAVVGYCRAGIDRANF
jgi:hypothetical protein